MHGIVPARNSFRYCPYEVVVAVFTKMLEMGVPKDIVIGAIGSQLWHSVNDIDDWLKKCCEVEGCLVRPTFNQRGVRPAIRCAAHKLPGMVDVKNKPCEFKKQRNANAMPPPKRFIFHH